jgi:predicted SprT family Zn-dependent metalloprotease/flagellar biosynthesis chaperone FliJ
VLTKRKLWVACFSDRKPRSESDQEVSKSETPSDNSGVSSSSDEALRKRPGLTSPKKLPRIPKTPHRPSSDLFWDKDFIDDWNDEHSPRKQLFPDATASRPKSPTKDKKPAKGKNPKDEDTMASQQLSSREARKAKKAFEEARDAIAQQFLQELDTTITKGRVSELTASTGGVKIVWSKTLQRTAGRAHWKVEPVRVLRPVNQPVGSEAPVIPVPSKPPSTMKIPYGYELVTSHSLYHASIELAEKVVTDELRLLNVMAHEFCHLANYATYFMAAGQQKNVAAHGKEFQQWGRAVTSAFAHRGVLVTTKHSWDIEYKYIWECVDCFLQFKRHSKSIDPAKQRCGRCKGRLNQIKPKPRGGGQAAGADEPTEITPHGAAREVSLPPASSRSSTPSGPATAAAAAAAAAPKVSAYQQFLKENMRAIRAEKPNTPHKEVMKLAAERWQEHKQRVAMMQASKAAIAEVVLLESSQGESEMEEEESVEPGGLVGAEV